MNGKFEEGIGSSQLNGKLEDNKKDGDEFKDIATLIPLDANEHKTEDKVEDLKYWCNQSQQKSLVLSPNLL